MLHMTWYTSTLSSLSVVTPDLKAEEMRYVLSAIHAHTQKYACMKTHTHTHTCMCAHRAHSVHKVKERNGFL